MFLFTPVDSDIYLHPDPRFPRGGPSGSTSPGWATGLEIPCRAPTMDFVRNQARQGPSRTLIQDHRAEQPFSFIRTDRHEICAGGRTEEGGRLGGGSAGWGGSQAYVAASERRGYGLEVRPVPTKSVPRPAVPMRAPGQDRSAASHRSPDSHGRLPTPNGRLPTSHRFGCTHMPGRLPGHRRSQ
jgi:hypothetical protein